MVSIGFGVGFVALLVSLAGPTPESHPGRGDFPAEAEVTVDALDVHDEPDEASTSSARLQKGDRVTVRDVEQPGWLAIVPPPGSFCWIEESALGTADGEARARVVSARALVRSGHPQARMPGLPRVELTRGTLVRLLNRPPLTIGEGRQRRTWRAIAPPPGDLRHVRAAGVRIVEKSASRPEGGEEEESISPQTGEIRAGYTPEPAEAPVAPEVAGTIAQIDALHRAILRQPVEQWRLEEVRQRYEALLKSVTDAATGNAIRQRIDTVARHEALAQDARQIQTLLERSRRRDGSIALYIRRLADAQKPQARPYVLQGLIQPSSRKVGGQKVFALIGRDGSTEAYLDIPPGIEVKGFLTHRVGVRGSVHYDDALRARVVSVREVEALDAEPESLSGH